MVTNFIVKYFRPILIALCLLIILPYFLACQYIHPFYDDFFFAGQIETNGAYGFVRFFYLNWSGRYSEEILMGAVNARIVGSSNLQYVLLGIGILLSVFLSFFYLSNALFKKVYSFINRFLIAIVSFSFFLVFMPELFTSLYWYCSSYYLLCLAFLIFNIGLLINMTEGPKSLIYKIAVLVLNIFIAGFSEITIFTFGLLYLSIIIHQYYRYKKIDGFWLTLLIVFVSFALFNILSPGNSVRMHSAKPGHSNGFVFSSVRAVYDFILFHGIYTFFKTPLLFFVFILLPAVVSYIKTDIPVTRIFKINPLFPLCTSLLIFYLHHALSIYGAGYTLQGRVFNFSIFLFYLAFIYSLLVTVYYFSIKTAHPFFQIPPIASKVSILLIVFLFNMSDNSRLLWGDLYRELPSFQKELSERYQIIADAKKSGASEVIVPIVKSMPKLYIFGEGAACQTTCFVNEHRYLKEASDYFKIQIQIKE
jgi:hypothetical protein